MGHTLETKERIDFLANALQTIVLNKTFETRQYSYGYEQEQDIMRAVKRLRLLKEAKHTTTDSLFMSKITELLERRNVNMKWRYVGAGVLFGLESVNINLLKRAVK